MEYSIVQYHRVQYKVIEGNTCRASGENAVNDPLKVWAVLGLETAAACWQTAVCVIGWSSLTLLRKISCGGTKGEWERGGREGEGVSE